MLLIVIHYTSPVGFTVDVETSMLQFFCMRFLLKNEGRSCSISTIRSLSGTLVKKKENSKKAQLFPIYD
jgi:hypothetical protein